MIKNILSLVVGLELAVSAWAQVPPYIGALPYTWATTNAVTATAGSVDPFFTDGSLDVSNTINGGYFQEASATDPYKKPAYEGATYYSDGTNISYNVLWNAWRGHQGSPSGLANPTGRTTNTANVGGTQHYAQNWLSFQFNKPYDILSMDIWNGAYNGGFGGGGDYSLRDVYIDYKLGNGSWVMASSTIRLTRVPDLMYWNPPTDHIVVGITNVTQVVITPINSWAEDCSWDVGYCGTADTPYFSPYAVFNEIRFYIPPSPPPSLTIGLQGTDVTVSWPNNVVGYNLESSTLLGTGASWNPVNGVVNNSVTIPSPAGTQFYRLKQQ